MHSFQSLFIIWKLSAHFIINCKFVVYKSSNEMYMQNDVFIKKIYQYQKSNDWVQNSFCLVCRVRCKYWIIHFKKISFSTFNLLFPAITYKNNHVYGTKLTKFSQFSDLIAFCYVIYYKNRRVFYSKITSESTVDNMKPRHTNRQRENIKFHEHNSIRIFLVIQFSIKCF